MIAFLTASAFYGLAYGVDCKLAFSQTESLRNAENRRAFSIRGRKMIIYDDGFIMGDHIYEDLVSYQLDEPPLLSAAEYEQQVIQSWSPQRFSNPRSFDPDNFRFMVHGILDKYEFSQRLTEDLSLPIVPYHLGDLRTLQDPSIQPELNAVYQRARQLILNPHHIERLGKVSASVITNEKLGTIATSGFILEFSFNHIYVSASYDFGSDRNWGQTTDEYLNNYNRHMGIDTLDSVLERSVLHNEILLSTSPPEGPKLRVSGIYLKYINPTTSAIHPERERDLIQTSKRFGLPIVKIIDPSAGSNSH